MRRLSIIAIASLLIFTACVPTIPLDRGSPSSSSSFSSTSSPSSSPSLEPGDVPVSDTSSSTSSETLTTSGALMTSERLTPDGWLEIGNERALHTLTIVTNHACYYCSVLSREQLPRIQRDFVSRGLLKVRIGAASLAKYPNSDLEARALLCAAAQGKGLTMHDALFSLSPRSATGIAGLAKKLALDTKTFDTCMNAPETATMAQGAGSGVTLVPQLTIGTQTITGLPEWPDTRGMIEEAIRK